VDIHPTRDRESRSPSDVEPFPEVDTIADVYARIFAATDVVA